MSVSAGTLAAIVEGRLAGDESVEVDDVVHDSGSAAPGKLFVAVRGTASDGHTFVSQAVARGCEVVCVDHPMDVEATQLVVDDTRLAMGPLASAVHGDPSRSLPIIGVTGTNGKTTVTHFIESIATTAGLRAGLIGTIRTSVAGRDLPATGRTTPEASDFQRLLATMRDAGAEVVAAEISSHALELGRVRGTRFQVAAFTNLSQDHLDFHGDMTAYRHAKERLFSEYPVASAVLNVDDPVGRDIAGWASMPKLTVGEDASYSATTLAESLRGTTIELNTRGRVTELDVPVVGRFNVQNLLLAAVCCLALGLEESVVVEAMRQVTGVPGRFESVSVDGAVGVIVDYAHTPEGIQMVIQAARRLTDQRVIAVVGAGGDRDRAKRPLMGRAAATADLVVVTNDNPRSEDPAEIATAVVGGLPEGTSTIVELDRRRAIARAIEAAAPGDLVLILGKGHEKTQETGGVVSPFSDQDVAREILAGRRYPDQEPESGSMST
jgi:UDP-N-acetylmuramoyl-L-alanyl-D-glutamate--2,6-diaminopimelate ligase